MTIIASAWAALIKAAPVRLWALIMAGPPLTVFAAGLTVIVWRGPWPDALAGQQLSILGYGLFIALALIGVIVISLAAVKVKGSALGGSFEVEGDDDPAPTVTTTTTTAVSPGATQ